MNNGAVIARSSQPEVGWLGWRSPEDEDLLKALSDACSYDKGESTMVDSSGIYLDAGEEGGAGNSSKVGINGCLNEDVLFKRYLSDGGTKVVSEI